MKFHSRVRKGIANHPKRFIVILFICYSIVWALVEPFMTFIIKDPPGIVMYSLMVLISVGVGVLVAAPPKEVVLKIKNTDTQIRIVFGDLFGIDGSKVIPANEFFDSEIGQPVSAKSLHGIFINKILGGQSSSFDKIVQKSLENTTYETVKRDKGKPARYPIGTTAIAECHNSTYFIVASAKTNTETLKAYSDVAILWKGLQGLWQTVRTNAGGYPVNIPLIGGGLAGIGLPTSKLLQIIIMSIVNETKKVEITKEIRIVLTEDRFEDVDLAIIKKSWS